MESMSATDTTSSTISSGLTFTNFTETYLPVNGFSYRFFVTGNNDTVATFERTFSGGTSYTEVIYNTVDNLSITEFENE